MTLAARGYVLLVINATIAILLLKISPELSEEKVNPLYLANLNLKEFFFWLCFFF